MKKIIKLFFSLILFTTSIIWLTSCNKSNKDNAIVRSRNEAFCKDDYFDSLVETTSETYYKTIAKKKISYDALEGFESVSLYEEEYLITYEVTTNLCDRTIVLNVYYDSTYEHIIENFTGVPMINYLDEEDILFSIDDWHIFCRN